MLFVLILIIIWTIYIMKCSYDRFHNIGKLDKNWRYNMMNGRMIDKKMILLE
jgi:hypothetical protein